MAWYMTSTSPLAIADRIASSNDVKMINRIVNGRSAIDDLADGLGE